MELRVKRGQRALIVYEVCACGVVLAQPGDQASLLLPPSPSPLFFRAR